MEAKKYCDLRQLCPDLPLLFLYHTVKWGHVKMLKI